MIKKIILGISLLGIIFVVGFWGYGSYYDNRKAENLSAYCNIDFRSELDEQTNIVKKTTLSIVDFRYSRSPLKEIFTITIDGDTYGIAPLEVGLSAPDLSLISDESGQGFKVRNNMLIDFPRPILEKIKVAKEIRVSFCYTDSDKTIDLPLSAPDLKYWQGQLERL